MMCAVTGCRLQADEVHVVHIPVEASYPVCEMHHARIDAGEDWAPGDEPGSVPGEHPTAILMEEDLPWRVLAVSAVKSGGSRPGLLLRLTMVRNGGSKEFEALVPHDEAEILKGLLEP